MAMIEVDELQFAELKRISDAANLIGADPGRRARLQELLAEAAPDKVGDVPILRREVKEAVAGIEKKFDDFIAEQKKEREERTAAEERGKLEGRWMTSRAKAREAGYNTDEALTALEDFMEKNGVADHELAMPAFERLHPPPEPVVSASSRWNFFDQMEGATGEANKALLEGRDEAFLAAMLPAALKEGRGGR